MALSKEKNGKFYFVLWANNGQSPLYCYIFEKPNNQQALKEIKYCLLLEDSIIEMCMPSIENEGVFFVEDYGYSLRFKSLNGTAETNLVQTLYRSPLRIKSIRFSGSDENRILVTTHKMLYLFAVENVNGALRLNILWARGESQLNLSLPGISRAFGFSNKHSDVLRKITFFSHQTFVLTKTDRYKPFFETDFFTPSMTLDTSQPNSNRPFLDRPIEITQNATVYVCKPKMQFFNRRPEIVLLEILIESRYTLVECTYDVNQFNVKYVNITNDLYQQRLIKDNYHLEDYPICGTDNVVKLCRYIHEELGQNATNYTDLSKKWISMLLDSSDLEGINNFEMI
jgi:hypothetical protein